MKSLQLLVLSSYMLLLMNCTGGSESNSQQKESQADPKENQSEQVAQTEPSPELAQKMETGKSIYDQYCIVCHQADGNGVTGAFPSLHQTEYVQGDKTQLISILLKGLQGPVEVKGEQFNNVMPQHNFLTDDQIAAVLTYVRSSWDNNADEVKAEEVKEVRDKVAADSTSK